jgi:hypothetical protein
LRRPKRRVSFFDVETDKQECVVRSLSLMLSARGNITDLRANLVSEASREDLRSLKVQMEAIAKKVSRKFTRR